MNITIQLMDKIFQADLHLDRNNKAKWKKDKLLTTH